MLSYNERSLTFEDFVMENTETVVAAPEVHSRFAKLIHDMEVKKAAREADKAVKQAQKEARQKLPIVAKKRDNNKKDAAQRIIEAADSSVNNGELARKISAELEITYANAYYYVTRVFKR